MNIIILIVSIVIVIILLLTVFRFKFVFSTPMALRKIVDKISDSYVVLDDNDSILDYNKTFLATFKFKDNEKIRKENFIQLLEDKKYLSNEKKLAHSILRAKETGKTISYEEEIKK